MTAVATVDVAARVAELLKSFKLPTAAAEMGQRLTDAGHDAALEVVGEVLEAEREDRWSRRIARLRHDSKLPPGKSFDGFDLTRLPVELSRSLQELARADFLDSATNAATSALAGPRCRRPVSL